jgi:hypothetical protein
LRAIVDELIPDTERRPEYLLFARELDLCLRRVRRPSVLHSGLWSLNSDFSVGTKRTVAKWFRRGLSGRTLWRIGEALIGRLFPAGR